MGLFDFFTRRATKKKSKVASKSKSFSLFGSLKRLFIGKPKVDAGLLEAIEEVLITADMGLDTADDMIKMLKKRCEGGLDLAKAIAILKEHTVKLLTVPETEVTATPEADEAPLYVVLVVGVNGVGKTTTIGKLAFIASQEGKEVMIGAADTFRAAAIEQLQLWGERIKVPVFSQGMHKDPGAVAYSAVEAAMAAGKDLLLVDTAGRLHNKVGLMNELAKVKRVIKKKIAQAPQEVLLVIDGSTGENAWQQARLFHETLGVTGIIVTKLDGMAKGGAVIGITKALAIPIRYIGVGEKMEDLHPFDPAAFAEQLFGDMSRESG